MNFRSPGVTVKPCPAGATAAWAVSGSRVTSAAPMQAAHATISAVSTDELPIIRLRTPEVLRPIVCARPMTTSPLVVVAGSLRRPPAGVGGLRYRCDPPARRVAHCQSDAPSGISVTPWVFLFRDCVPQSPGGRGRSDSVHRAVLAAGTATGPLRLKSGESHGSRDRAAHDADRCRSSRTRARGTLLEHGSSTRITGLLESRRVAALPLHTLVSFVQ